MLRDDNGNGGGRPSTPRNVLGERLEVCSISPMTGSFLLVFVTLYMRANFEESPVYAEIKGQGDNQHESLA